VANLIMGSFAAVCGCGRLGFDEIGTPDLVVHLAFDSDGLTFDRARGHAVACAKCPVQVAGKLGEAARFDGTSYLLVQDAPDLRPTAFTFAAWGMASAVNATLLGRPLNQGAGPGPNTFQLFIINGTTWYVGFNGGGVLSAPATADTWHHIAGSFDGTRVTMFLDGVQIGATDVGAAQYGNDDLLIGADLNNSAVESFWIGLIDDVRLYDQPLTAFEIADLATPR
jgi:hypothetical protein